MICERYESIDAAVQGALDRLKHGGNGPDHVLMDATGSIRPTGFMDKGWTECACVLVGNNGWLLGCRRALYDSAKELWPGKWVAVICYANTPHRVVIKLAR